MSWKGALSIEATLGLNATYEGLSITVHPIKLGNVIYTRSAAARRSCISSEAVEPVHELPHIAIQCQSNVIEFKLESLLRLLFPIASVA